MIIRIFAAREPAKPLNDAQMCGSFLFLWVYGNNDKKIKKRNAQSFGLQVSPFESWLTLLTDPLKVYFDMCIIKYFLDIISLYYDMLDKMNRLFATFPEIDKAALVFPVGWEKEPLWQYKAYRVTTNNLTSPTFLQLRAERRLKSLNIHFFVSKQNPHSHFSTI